MRKLVSLNIGIILALMMCFLLAYYFLIYDNFFHASISSIISQSNDLESKKHLLVLGLLPIYIGTVIFGMCSLGVCLGSYAQKLMLKSCKENKRQ